MMKSKDYLKKVTSAHCHCPNYMEWLRVLLDVVCDFGKIMEDLPVEFAIRRAVGAQLDILGRYLGATRYLPYTNAQGLLNDDDFRLYLLALILKSKWDGQMGSLTGIWQQIYPEISLKIKDNFDMTVTVEFRGALSVTMQEMIQAGMILPMSMGVESIYTVIVFSIPTQPVYLDTGLYAQGEMGITNQEP